MREYRGRAAGGPQGRHGHLAGVFPDRRIDKITRRARLTGSISSGCELVDGQDFDGGIVDEVPQPQGGVPAKPSSPRSGLP